MAKGAASFESRGSSYEKQNRQPLQVFVTRYSRLADLRQHGSCRQEGKGISVAAGRLLLRENAFGFFLNEPTKPTVSHVVVQQ